MNSTTEPTSVKPVLWTAEEATDFFQRIQKEYQRVTWPLVELKKFGRTELKAEGSIIALELTYISLAYNVETGCIGVSLGNYNQHNNLGLPMAKEYVSTDVDATDPEFAVRSLLATVVSTEFIGAQGEYIERIVDALWDDDNDFVDLPFGPGVPLHFYDINFLVDYFSHRAFI